MENKGLILAKIKAYCDKAERCHRDVRNKLFAWKVPADWHDDFLADLISNNLLNEERYALAFVHDHHVFRKWGKEKIKQGLKRKQVSAPLIALALKSVQFLDEEDNLRSCAVQKIKKLGDENPLKKKSKLIRYLYGRGFEMDAIHRITAELMGDFG